jgi:hypothetical protein
MINISCDVTPSSLVDKYQCFERNSCFCLQGRSNRGRFLRNVGTYILIRRYQSLEDDNPHSPRRENPKSHNNAFVINVSHDLMPKYYTNFSKY